MTEIIKKPFFSIIIPSYNVSAYIEHCIESIINDYLNDYEVIIIDDGSTDDTYEKILPYTKKIDNISLYKTVNSGLSSTRNYGVDLAKGKYIVFIDGDDFILQGVLKDIYFFLKSNDVDIYITNMIEEFENNLEYKDIEIVNNYTDYISKDDIITTVFSKSSNTWPSVRYILKKEFVLKNNLRFQKNTLHEDVRWTTEIFLLAEKIYYSNQYYYVHRLFRTGSITTKMNIKRVFDVFYLVDYCLDLINQTSIIEIKTKKAIQERLSLSAFGMLRFSYKVDKNQQYKVIKDIKSKIIIFSYSKKLKHRLFFYTAKILGVKTAFNISKTFNNY
jgi:glycosyltransferase involved in cell wall biosynthesis